MSPKTVPLFLFTLSLLFFTGQSVTKFEKEYFLAADPYWLMLVSRSLVTDGDLDLTDEHEFKPENVADQVALGKNGEWFPLHEPLLGVLGAPFYALFGERGCLLLNLLIASGFSVVLYALAARFVPPRPAFVAAILTSLCSAIAAYAYSFSIDLLGAFLFSAASLALLYRKHVLSGALFGLMVLSRNAIGVTVPAFLLVLFLEGGRGEGAERKLKRLSLFLLGGVPFALLFFLMNYIQYGSPWTLSYARWVPFQNGQLVLTPQSGDFGGSLLAGGAKMLFHPVTGLIPGSPLLLLALFLGGRETWRRAKEFSLFAITSSLALLLLFSSYERPYPAFGNRYLLAVVALSVVPMGYLLARVFSEGSEEGELESGKRVEG